jgi:Ca-activated chloride channel family protein
LPSRLLLGCVATLLASSFVIAQSPAAWTGVQSNFLAPLTTISKTVDEVDLAFTVTDSKGRFVSNLGAKDFELLDNHLAPQQLTYFQQRSDLPLHVAILIDTSASVKYRFGFEQRAAVDFIRRILRPSSDKALVITFNDRTNVIDATSKDRRVSKLLKKIKAEGNTALYDAVTFAAAELRRLPEPQITRRAIVLISDGEDTASHTTLEEAKHAAAMAELTVFALTTNFSELDPNSEGDAALKELASSTGGALLSAHDEDQLSFSLRKVDKALHNQYVIAYRPTEFQADGSYRTLDVTPLKNGLRINCRNGYYARAKP